jgi:signal recognition particle receptor subunit beta
MVQINFAQKQVNAKIVYYGPGMSGKTTNLEIVYQRAPQPNRGELTSISTDGDRTLFFDFMPLDLGTVAGMRTCFQIYTVPGQVYYNSTRKLVLQGVDGVVFVADSSAAMKEENLEAMRNLEQNLNEYGKSLATMPLIIQYNKRDLPDAVSVDELNALLNPHSAPFFEAIANTGQGVFPTLKALAARVLDTIHTGAKSGAQVGAAPISTGQTGFHPAPNIAAGQAAPAGIHPAVRPLQQTGFATAAQVQGVRANAAVAAKAGAGAHGAQAGAKPPAMPPGAAGSALGMMGGAAAGGVQPQSSLRIATPASANGPEAAHGAPGNGQMSSNALSGKGQGGAAGGANLHLNRAEPSAPGNAAHKRAPNAARPAPKAEAAGRAQPRAQALPTPVPGSRKKSAVYTALFVIVALGVGAVVARLAMSFF